MTLTALSKNSIDTAEDSTASTTVELFKELAQKFKIAIVFGVVFRDGDKVTNNALMLDSNGRSKGIYIISVFRINIKFSMAVTKFVS